MRELIQRHAVRRSENRTKEFAKASPMMRNVGVCVCVCVCVCVLACLVQIATVVSRV